LANRRSNPLRRLVLLYLLHLLHRLQELYLLLERRLCLLEWLVVQGKLGNYQTGGEANDNITKKKNVHVKRGTKLVLFYCVFIAFQSRYIFLNKPTRALLFLVSVSFCPLPSTAPKKARFMFILVNGLVFGFEASRRKRRANISLKPAKYLRRYSRCKHRMEKYLSA